MSNVAIEIDGLSKHYRIGQHVTYKTLRDSITEAFQSPFRRFRASSGERTPQGDWIWALKDISFSINQGEVMGIIGPNGAGKSTLLKVLTRITEPTDGCAKIRGRVGSLLEVGTGFHPELTGRENIYLNGAILGMRRAEIERKFDEIVAFSEIEKFIDTPVKRYSSGMYMRLAFSVAAHLEPDILVVDEVLAVGDSAFQRKCLGKMEDVAIQGRTVLFVSHNMPAITRLCSSAILLEAGKLILSGTSIEVTSAYLSGITETGASRTWSPDAAVGTDGVKLTGMRLIKEDGSAASVVEVQEPLKLEIDYYVAKPNQSFRCAAPFYTQGVCAFTAIEPAESERADAGYYRSVLSIPPNLLAEGEYTVGASMFSSRGAKRHFVRISNAITFQVYDSMTRPSARGDYAQNLAGVMRPLLEWGLEYQGNGKEVKR